MRLHATVWYRALRDSRITARRELPAVVLLEGLARPRPRPVDKAHLPLWSPARYAPDATRRGNAGVVSMSCLVLDFDTGAAPADTLSGWPWLHAWYASYSWADDSPRWRLVVPLASDVPVAHWPAVWTWARERAPHLDRACSDPARAYYLPCEQAEGGMLWALHPGELLDVGHVRPPEKPRVAPTAPRPDRGGGIAQERDPHWREQAGLAAGGRVAGGRVTRATCPACGRPSAWWWLSPDRWGGAACDHRSSCGWTGGVRQVVGS